MPTIDLYLKVGLERQAQSLWLVSNERPYLVTAKGKFAAGKAITDSQLRQVLLEIVPASMKNRLLEKGETAFDYIPDSVDGVGSKVSVRTVDDNLIASFELYELDESGDPINKDEDGNSMGAVLSLDAFDGMDGNPQPATIPKNAKAKAYREIPKVDPADANSKQLKELAIAHTFNTATDSRKEIDRYLMKMAELRASDVHLCSGRRPVYRIDGDLIENEKFPVLEAEHLSELFHEIIGDDGFREIIEKGSFDLAYEIHGVARFRVNIFKEYGGVSASVRLIPSKVLSAESLNLPQAVCMLASLPKGLVIVTGPTGSGKSTTLAGLLDLVNRSRPDHILTVEQPIEFLHQSKRCLIHQREVGIHTTGFQYALRDALREDPDVVLVGEMRDLETISTAIETAATGHLVFGTLHTNTAISTVDRIIEMFPADEQEHIRTMLADSLRCVISQTLLKRVKGGRVAALEVLMVTPSIANMIREKKTYQIANIMQTSKSLGMQMLADELLKLVKAKVVEPGEAYLKAIDKIEILKRFEENNIRFKPTKEMDFLDLEG